MTKENPFANMAKVVDDLRAQVDAALLAAKSALLLGGVLLDESEKLRAEIARMTQERAAIGAFGFRPSGVRS